jgi:putative FmdB family regulatory protein
MPIYEYDCQECGKHFEKLVRSSSTDNAITCPSCASTRCVKSLSCFCTTHSSAGAGQGRAEPCANTG